MFDTKKLGLRLKFIGKGYDDGYQEATRSISEALASDAEKSVEGNYVSPEAAWLHENLPPPADASASYRAGWRMAVGDEMVRLIDRAHLYANADQPAPCR
jgi:hypothetical protein